jgi:hypothetical protein
MKSARWAFLGFVILIGVIGIAGFITSQFPRTVSLRFSAVAGDQPLQLNALRYENPNGDGVFKVRDFQFYVSNIKLVSPDGDNYIESESYHLVRFDSDSQDFIIQLTDVPRSTYTHIEFGLGVDADANGSIASVGDLDPNSRMAWNWEVGYKFVLVEGGIEIGDLNRPLVYHVGFNENYKPQRFPLSKSEQVEFEVNLIEMFSDIDMASTSNVKFDRDDAKQLANNYADMISLVE